MTAHFDKTTGVVDTDRKRTELVKQELLATQRTAEYLKRDNELAVIHA